MTAPRHFLTLMDLSADEIRLLIDRAIELKAQWRAGNPQRSMEGKVLAMIFTKASTRTRVSFEAGMAQLGGSALFCPGRIRSWVRVNRSRIPPKSSPRWSIW